MPLRLDIKRKLAQRSVRVKCVDLHPSEPCAGADEADRNWKEGGTMVRSARDQENGPWHLGLSEAWVRRRQRIADNRRSWALVEPYRPPPRLMPLLLLNVAAFYTGVVAAAVTEQLYKEKYWDEHPGAAVPIMHPLFYIGPYKVTREDFSEENAS